MIEGEKGKPFQIHETGWGEFEIAIKLYYVPESAEKPQTLYHHLRLHPYGRTEAEKEAMRLNGNQVISWAYEEQIFNEPYEPFYEILTSGAIPPSIPASALKAASSPSASSGFSFQGKSQKEIRDRERELGFAPRTEGGVLERSAMIPLTNRPGQPFSRETEQLEIKKLKEAAVKVEEMMRKLKEEVQKKEKLLKELKEENAKG